MREHIDVWSILLGENWEYPEHVDEEAEKELRRLANYWWCDYLNHEVDENGTDKGYLVLRNDSIFAEDLTASEAVDITETLYAIYGAAQVRYHRYPYGSY